MQPSRQKSPLILVDLDDVLSRTNEAAVKWHNNVYGTQLTLDDLHCELLLQAFFGWGTPRETMVKAQIFYASTDFLQAEPVPGAQSALTALVNMGFRLAILTTRSIDLKDQTHAWLTMSFPGIFDSVYFSGMEELRKESTNKQLLSKGEMCRKLEASLLIDDAVENVLSCANCPAGQTPSLLFGSYEWNRRCSATKTDEDRMSFIERVQHELAKGRTVDWWENDTIELGYGIWRVRGWPEVVSWVQNHTKELWG
ncbi:hypothetical protein BU17DRAFT_38778 [Hysterangium stoloniferum]|nr:hypothetical protein BU17DRAFT_38778 [Hysterangium stoloniferum]